MELDRMETQQYGMAQTSADEQPPDKLDDADYVSSNDIQEVGKSIERTEEEVLQRLSELGQARSLIEGICKVRVSQKKGVQHLYYKCCTPFSAVPKNENIDRDPAL